MAHLCDTTLRSTQGFTLLKKVGTRTITHAIHDIDGTHSLIRDWPPVMSLCIHYAMTCGLRDDFDSPSNALRLIDQVGATPLPETDRFCVESAGLSALTQMEFGLRRAIELKTVTTETAFSLTPQEEANNTAIIQRIWNGEERFEDIQETESLKNFLAEKTPRLFKLYETVLNGACRDKNTAAAWKNPEPWRVPGSLAFMEYLYQCGITNYFVTGAVIYPEGGMYEEVQACRFDIGPGKQVEALEGSSWDKKMPKDEVMQALCKRLHVLPEHVLVVGDGRTEIKAGADMGAVVMSRLPKEARRLRELHQSLGAHYIVEDYQSPLLQQLIQP